uniref:Uncharacterized protein n=1 Tax=Triticum urartu TaxID=4572 RepID=A0A8R7QSM5_TRIUA
MMLRSSVSRMFSLPKGWPEMVLRLYQLPIRASLRYYTTGDQIKVHFYPCSRTNCCFIICPRSSNLHS